MISRALAPRSHASGAGISSRPLTVTEATYFRGRARYARFFAWTGVVGFLATAGINVVVAAQRPRNTAADAFVGGFALLGVLGAVYSSFGSRVRSFP